MKTSTCIAFATALLLAMTCAMSATDDAAGDGPGFEQCRPDLIEGSVEWNRDRMSRTYPDLQEELGVDKPTRERLIDILNDHWMIEHEDVNNHDMRKRADAITTMLRSVSAVIGDARMDTFYAYMHDRSESHEYEVLNAALPQEARLSSAQKAQFFRLVRTAHREQAEYQSDVWPGAVMTNRLSADDQWLIHQLGQALSAEASLSNWQKLTTGLERDAEKFLSPLQLEALRTLHQKELAASAKTNAVNFPPLDPDKAAYIRNRVATLPHYQQRKPIADSTPVRIAVTVDDRQPVTVTGAATPGTPIPVVIDELAVEITRPLGNGGSYKTRFFTTVAGERRELLMLEMNGRGSEDASYTQTAVVEGARQGYVVKTEIRVER
jgi:hypothetical protein